MEDSKKIFKFYGKSSEDFQLWAARTEAALQAKEVYHAVESDILGEGGGDIEENLKKAVATACAVLIQGLGDRPLRLLRLCMSDRSNLFRMWRRLWERYAVSNTATRIQLQSRLSRLSYTGQSMADYVDSFEEIFNRLAAMQSEVAEEMQIDMLLASIGDVNRSSYRQIVTSLQTMQDTLTWETFTASLLQAYDDTIWQNDVGRSKTKSTNGTGQVLAAADAKRVGYFGKRQKKPFIERRRCFSCRRIGHIAKNCPIKNSKEREESLTGTDDSFFNYEKSDAKHVTLLTAVGNGSADGVLVQDKHEIGRNICLHSNESRRNHSFLLDSGASDHMVMHSEWLKHLRPISKRAIVLGDRRRVFADSRGTLLLRCTLRNGKDKIERTIQLDNVLLVPTLHANLISISKLCEKRYKMTFSERKCIALLDDMIEFQGMKENGVYLIVCTAVPNISLACFSTSADSNLTRWHERFGHASKHVIQQLARTNAVRGLDLDTPIKDRQLCRSCQRGKQTKNTLRINVSRSQEKGAVIHSDVCCPMSTTSFGESRYFVSFIDEFSGYMRIVPISRKSDVREKFIAFQAWFERKFDCKIKRIHSDVGGEYIALKGYCKDQGIEHTMSPPYSPNLNGMAERANRTIVECARSMLEHALLPRSFLAEAVNRAAYIRNMLFCPRRKLKTSHEVMFGEKPRVDHLKVFCCEAWNHIPKDIRRKLDAKSERGIVIGRCYDNSQYKLWTPGRRIAVMSRDVTISENIFPWKEILNNHNASRLIGFSMSYESSGLHVDDDMSEDGEGDSFSTLRDNLIEPTEGPRALDEDEREALTNYPVDVTH